MTRDIKDILGGGLLLLGGLSYSIYTVTHYTIGTLRQAGPGFFPLALGLTLVLLGALVLLPALKRRGEMPEFQLFAPIMVLASVAVFALAIPAFGLIPAIVGMTITFSLAERRFRPISLALSCILLSLSAYLIFGVGLGMSVAMLRWPF